MGRKPVPLEIRGVEQVRDMGRVSVVRFLCRHCRHYFHDRQGFYDHWEGCTAR